MAKQVFYVPILPSTGPPTPVQSVPYQAPDFWPLVNVLREVMYRFKSREPTSYDLPQLGKDKPLDRQVNLFIESKWGNKNVSAVFYYLFFFWSEF